MRIFKPILLLSIILLISSCGLTNMANKYDTVKFTVTPPVLQTHGGEIEVKIDGNFPEKYFAKKATVELIPVLIYNDNQSETAFEKIILQGEEATGGDKTIFFNSGGSFSYQSIVPYKKDMQNARLELRAVGKMADPTGEIKEQVLGPINIANGTLATPTRIINEEEVADNNHNYEKETILKEQATIYFLVNQSNIRTTEKSDDDILKLKEFAKNGYKTHSIEIMSYASPEGSVERNDKVSDKRMKSTVKYTRHLLNKLNVEGASNSELYTETSVGEDWVGFESIIQKSEIKDKRKISNLLNTIEDVEKREEQLRDMTEIYDAVKDDILPQLRKATIIIRAYEPKKTDEEINKLSLENPTELDLEEILYSTSLTNSEEEKIKILKSAIELHDDWRIFNNLSALYIKRNELNEAEKYLNKATKISRGIKNDILINNGIIHARKGNLNKAKELFDQANASELNFALLDIRLGNYDKAARYFKNKNSYNAVLAKILNGNNDVKCDEKTADCYYLNAISHARSGNENLAIKSLKKAIELNPEFKRDAKIDLEFVNFRNSETFNNTIN